MKAKYKKPVPDVSYIATDFPETEEERNAHPFIEEFARTAVISDDYMRYMSNYTRTIPKES